MLRVAKSLLRAARADAARFATATNTTCVHTAATVIGGTCFLWNTRHATHASCHRNQTHDQHKEAEPVSSAILVHQPRRQVGHELNNGGEPSHKAHTERERCPCAPHQVNLSNQHNTSVSRLKAPPKHHKCTCTQLT